MFYGASPEIFHRAKVLRDRLTPAERMLWEYLRKNQVDGYKFRRQHPISYFIVDFYCHAAKLVIEVDGSIHDTVDQREYDIYRTEQLQLLGLHVLRFDNAEVYHCVDEVLETIRAWLPSAPPGP